MQNHNYRVLKKIQVLENYTLIMSLFLLSYRLYFRNLEGLRPENALKIIVHLINFEIFNQNMKNFCCNKRNGMQQM